MHQMLTRPRERLVDPATGLSCLTSVCLLLSNDTIVTEMCLKLRVHPSYTLPCHKPSNSAYHLLNLTFFMSQSNHFRSCRQRSLHPFVSPKARMLSGLSKSVRAQHPKRNAPSMILSLTSGIYLYDSRRRIPRLNSGTPTDTAQ